MKIYQNRNSISAALYVTHVMLSFPSTEKTEYNESIAVPICNTKESTKSAFKLINALCVNCLENLQTLQDLLFELFYSGGCVGVCVCVCVCVCGCVAPEGRA